MDNKSNKKTSSNKTRTPKKKIVGKSTATKKKSLNKVTVEKKEKKINKSKSAKKDSIKVAIFPLLIGIFTLIVVTIGATYSYFNINSNNNFSTSNVNTTVDSIGSVALLKNPIALKIELNAVDMIKKKNDISYYASSQGTTTEETEEVLGTAKAIGNGKFNCEYDLVISVNGKNNMYEAFQSMNDKSDGQIVLTANGTDYDFNTNNLFPKTIHNKIYNLESGNDQDITAMLKIVNKSSVDQSKLAGTDITISFNVENFECIIATN